MSVPSGLDFSNVRHVRVWHEQKLLKIKVNS